MKFKSLLVFCLLVILAPPLMAQVQVPQRHVLGLPGGTNSPYAQPGAGVGPGGGPARSFPKFPPAFNNPKATAPLNPITTPAPLAATAGHATNAEVPEIEYNLVNTPIEQILDIYQALVGRTLLRATAGAAAIPAQTTIILKTDGKLTRSEAIVALETVLGMNGITIVPIGDKFAKIVTEATAPQAGDIISTNRNNIPLAGKFITQIVQLKYAAIDDVVKALTPFAKSAASIIGVNSTQTLILRDYSENVARMLEMVQSIDVLTPLVIKPEVIPIRYALAADISSALSALGASGGTSVGKSSSGANFSKSGSSSSSTTGTTGGFGGTGGSTGGYPGQPAQTSSSPMSSAATSGRSSFQNNLQRIVSNAANSGQFQLFGQTKIIADERTNSLLVFANDEDMKMIKTIIGKLDVVLAQVLIDAIIMEINLQDTQNTGVSYLSQKQGNGYFTGAGGVNNLSTAATSFLTGTSSTVTGGVTNTTTTATGSGSTLANLPGGFSYFAKFGNDLNVVLEAVAGDSRINVLSRPRIQTSHAVPADLFIGNTVPYVTGTYNYGYGSGPSSQYTQLEVGIHLQVLPLINPDGLVVMDIQADVEQLGPDVEIAGVGGVPTTTKRQAGAKVAVRNGETIILGGFISDSRSKALSGVPLLMNIPLLGNLFRSTSIENLRTELIMLMRPTVLPTPELAAVVATTERNRLSGVKAAEWEIREDEKKRNAKIEHEMAVQEKKDAEQEAKEARKNQKTGETNTVPLSSIPALEDQ
jgi:general secretion pathway protein D